MGKEEFEISRVGHVEDLMLEMHDDGAAQTPEKVVRESENPIPDPTPTASHSLCQRGSHGEVLTCPKSLAEGRKQSSSGTTC